MADGFIVRKGGVTTEQALAPTITEVSTTQTSITFTITNNDASTAVILYELDDATPDANSIELAAAATSSNIVVTGLASDTAFDVYATANVTGKVKSNVTELEISTDVPILYTAATGGTTAEYDSGGKRYKSHTFTSNGNFVVSTVGDAIDDRNKVDYLIIAGGGGGGGFGNAGGGGGAGGYRTTNGTSGANSLAESKVVVTAQGYTVTIGGGGAGRTSSVGPGSNGQNTSVLGITSTGGGGGGSGHGGAGNITSGLTGGSGGGGPANGTSDNSGLGTANQGFRGNRGDDGFSTYTAAGGGGGASSIGVRAGSPVRKGGDGGAGLANNLRIGSNETRAGGGGGGGQGANVLAGIGAGGSGGGGVGGRDLGSSSFSLPSAGTTNTGSGGGGSALSNNGANGGSGIVVIRYEIAPSV